MDKPAEASYPLPEVVTRVGSLPEMQRGVKRLRIFRVMVSRKIIMIAGAFSLVERCCRNPAMSYSVTPFEVVSNALPEPVKCRFVHLFPAISLRHSDTIDCIFLVNGRKVTVAISSAAITSVRERDKKSISDQQLAEISALFLRRTLQEGYDATQAELFLGEGELRTLGRELGYA